MKSDILLKELELEIQNCTNPPFIELNDEFEYELDLLNELEIEEEELELLLN
jgi:hypothetical protein